MIKWLVSLFSAPPKQYACSSCRDTGRNWCPIRQGQDMACEKCNHKGLSEAEFKEHSA